MRDKRKGEGEGEGEGPRGSAKNHEIKILFPFFHDEMRIMAYYTRVILGYSFKLKK
jgi:hypothetical protein